MTRGSPAGSLTKKPFVLNSRSNDAAVTSSGGPRDRKVSRMQMGMFLGLKTQFLATFFCKKCILWYVFFSSFSAAFNWITGKAGEHEDHRGLEAALEAEVAVSELNNQANQPLSRRQSTYLKNQQTKQQKGGSR